MLFGMQPERVPRRFTVTASAAPLAVGMSFPRTAWPAHVTLIGNFVTEASAAELEDVVRRSEVLAAPLVVDLGGTAWFGTEHDVPVRLALPGPIVDVHRSLAAQVEALRGFAADDPAFWRDGYRPHLTLGPAVSGDVGDRLVIGCVAVARLDRGTATITAAFDLPPAGGRPPATA